MLAAKRPAEACDALAKAVTLDGANPRYRTNLGFALAAIGRETEALAAFRGAAPEASAQSNLALAYEMVGDYTKAREHYAKALETDPSHKAAGEGAGSHRLSIEGDTMTPRLALLALGIAACLAACVEPKHLTYTSAGPTPPRSAPSPT